MKFNLKQITTIFFSILILVGIINFITILITENNTEDKERWVIHTYKVINEAQKLIGFLRDAETGQRGYLLTLSKEYLEPYNLGKTQSLSSYKSLKTLTKDNQNQQNILFQIDKLIIRKFDELAQTIQLTKLNNKEEALVIVNNDSGKQIMDDIRILISQFIDVEEKLLLTRSSEFQNEKNKIHVLYLILAVILIGIIIIGAIVVQKKLILPLATLTTGAKKIAEGKRLDTINDENISESENEIGYLIKAFNHMAIKVQQRTDEIILHQNNLQEMVDKQTFELKESLKEANVANKSKSEFLSQMSHELRTPLNAILGFGQLLECGSGKLDNMQKDNVKEILNAGNHLLELINEVLDLAKIESGKLEILIEEVFINDVIQQSLSLIHNQAQTQQIDIVNNINLENYSVKADFTRLKQILLNLLSNAIKYNCEQGSITLNAKATNNNYLHISIHDTGMGLSEKDITKLFMPFERFDKVLNVEGTGIGLTITKHLVELMKGNIGVESKIGKGSTFWFELPLN